MNKYGAFTITIILSLAVGLSPVYAQTTQPGTNWGQLCRNPVVDRVIVEPCDTLTTSGGYVLTPEGKRVVGCILGAGVLLLADPTGRALIEAQSLASTAGLCAGMTAPLTNPSNSPSPSSSTNDPLGNIISGLTKGNSPSSSSSSDPIGNLLGNLLGR